MISDELRKQAKEAQEQIKEMLKSKKLEPKLLGKFDIPESENPEFKHSPESFEPEHKPIIYKEFVEKGIEPVEWFVDRLIPKYGYTLLSADKGSYKTYLSLSIAVAVSTGNDWLGFETKQTSVLYIDEDNGPSVLGRRLQHLAPDDASFYIWTMSGFHLDSEEWIQWTIDFCKREKIKMVVIDVLRKVHSKEENSSTDMKLVFDMIKRFTVENIVLLVLHHSPKLSEHSDNVVRGTSALEGDAVSSLYVQRVAERRSQITQRKNRDGEEYPAFVIEAVVEEGDGKEYITGFENLGLVEESKTKKAAIKAVIKEILSERVLNAGDLHQEVVKVLPDTKLRTVKTAQKELFEAKEIFSEKMGRSKIWALSEEQLNDFCQESNNTLL